MNNHGTPRRRRTTAYLAAGLLIPGASIVYGLMPADAATQPRAGTGALVAAAPARKNLDDPAKKEVAMQIVSAAENSSLDWRAQFSYIEDIDDGRGYTAGIIGFCSGTGDMLELVEAYTRTTPSNVLARYLPALRRVNGSDSHAGLDPNYPRDWRRAAQDPAFRAAQEAERDRVYFNPSVAKGKSDGVRALGQFAYYDAAVVHGYEGMESIRSRALRRAKPPAQGGDETRWLNVFLDERVVEMKKEAAHEDVSRIETAQRVFLRNGNLDLNTPLDFAVYGDPYHIG
ncbi:chitosanase [Amorphoplanes digitatis]|uniref:Chitosanase n=1 Tax=Actinoplanes digitatis TaxID=1868 RepID=A0A7W7HVB2_9ACTN|nr:chitosanase [Actinoplanes digitatis]MBB4761462.1 chitosanase [Actinoplanes digitatis]BFE69962.1 chitosanase CsnA [Actinoplanes digitatis]GID97692.1 chitosanase [Actinoplanes digitatis]